MVRIKLADVELDLCSINDLNAVLAESIRLEECRLIANHNLHSVYLFHTDPRMKEFFKKAYTIHIDGMWLVYLAQLYGYPARRAHRVTYLDWIGALLEESVHHHWRVFYLGGKPGVADRAARLLCQKHFGLQLETQHGYFQKTGMENNRVLERINSYRPHILLVGMGMPLQEHWILDNLDAIETNAILAAGACFDYIAGEIPAPPRWIGQIGLEWLFRLASEPRRLWRRYLVEPWYVFGLLVRELFR